MGKSKQLKLSIGDIVKIIADTSSHGYHKGEEVEVIHVTTYTKKKAIFVECTNGKKKRFVYLKDLIHAKSINKPIDDRQSLSVEESTEC